MVEGKRRGIMRGFLSDRFRPLVEITRKYRTPRIKMTRQVRIALFLLRVYLIFMVLILVFKFFTVV
jgi:hypothetical protein